MACSCVNKTFASKQLEALKRYFKKLSVMGYDKDNSAERLLIYSFVTEWVETDLNYFLTEDDYNVLNRLIRMISDTCLLPYKTYCTNRMVMGSPMLLGDLDNRITEDDIDRYTEDESGDNIRVVENRTKHR